MRRTNVVLDENLLEDAHRKSGEQTYSATINRALKALIDRLTAEEGLRILSGSNAWEGNLDEMRRTREFDLDGSVIRDAPMPPKRTRKPKRGTR
jgi:Arc/MetJ family transcription regulator